VLYRIAQLMRDHAEEARKLANASPYGLVAGIWTRDLYKAYGLAAPPCTIGAAALGHMKARACPMAAR
jgi:acyl-CoA reductase-like NAD-dependent aldehyde dehydrogenase